MAVFPTYTSKIASLDGQIHAAQKTISTLESLLGGDHDSEVSSAINQIENMVDSMVESRDFYAAKTSMDGSVPVNILIHNYARGFSQQAIVFDGWPMLCREKDKADAIIHLNALMAKPDSTILMSTMIGPFDVSLAQCQGLMYAGSVLSDAIKSAVEATISENQSVPFTSWEDIRWFFNQHFEGNYVPFISE